MSGEKYPAKLVEKVARGIATQRGRNPDENVKSATPSTIYHLRIKGRTAGNTWHYSEHAAWTEFKLDAAAALDAIPYAAMREALEAVAEEIDTFAVNPEGWLSLPKVRAALRAADGEET